MATARDKFWIFGVRPHQDDKDLGRNLTPALRYRTSRITPAEAAFMLDVPNMIMVNCDGEPVPFSPEAYGYMESFCRMNQVLWSSAGSGCFRTGNEEKFIARLAERYDNITGAFLDDFFNGFRKDPDPLASAEKLLQEIREGLAKVCRPMDLYAVWYTYEMDEPRARLIDQYIDGITLWTWECRELPLLEERYARIEKRFPHKKKMLGVYMYDFPTAAPVSDELMEHQCELGLRLMREGRLDGMIFETNSVMGCGLSSEKWLRHWLETAKYTIVPD